MRVVHAVLALGVAFSCTTGAAQSSAVAGTPQYRIECGAAPPCRVDLATYVGYRVFIAQCATCHAADVRGSSFAPDLADRLRGKTSRDFFTALDRGYLGPRSTMPPRGRDPNVAPYYDELWAFLSARRDGALPAGPVEPFDGTAAEPR